MLYEIYVENLALIRKLRLKLNDGLNALSGEAGAGKSLVVDAVSLLIGARANEGFIRSGADSCLIEGVFTPPFSAALKAEMAEQNLSLDDDIIILSRELNRNGRSICRLNQRTLPLAALRKLGRLLINIHGQMEHMLLLEEDQQLLLTDNFGGEALLSCKEQVAKLYGQMQLAQKNLDFFTINTQERQTRIALLEKQNAELDAAELLTDEEDDLRLEAKRLNSSEHLLKINNEALEAFNQREGLIDLADLARNNLHKTLDYDPALMPLSQRLDNLYYEAADIAHELAKYQSSIDQDSYRLEQVESRLGLLSRLKKKYNCTANDLPILHQSIKVELDELFASDDSGPFLEAALAKAQKAYHDQAAKLSKLRQKSGQILAEKITGELHLLNMSHAQFAIDLPASPPSAQGLEKALFMIKTNIGEQFAPVQKIASGGELSRIVLGMKVILAELDAVPTLVFDEVDTGLSGKALNSVAERLAFVAKSNQAIVVTHAPMMAAAADYQLRVDKQIIDDRTEISIEILDNNERLNEISRMIAGDNFSATTLNQAREMLAYFHP